MATAIIETADSICRRAKSLGTYARFQILRDCEDDIETLNDQERRLGQDITRAERLVRNASMALCGLLDSAERMHVLTELNYMRGGLITLLYDNKQEHHVRIAYYYVRREVDEGNLQLRYVKSEDNPADGVIKPLGGVQHQKFVTMLALTTVAVRRLQKGARLLVGRRRDDDGLSKRVLVVEQRSARHVSIVTDMECIETAATVNSHIDMPRSRDMPGARDIFQDVLLALDILRTSRDIPQAHRFSLSTRFLAAAIASAPRLPLHFSIK
ncbi:hypothetical protein F4777DRAFT_584937 [Nemania sp. FL0916]|nr:hypothetical protein F4777DRAFT_584937 [Nemania sp. FL0916]